jgi:hypothetical protein
MVSESGSSSVEDGGATSAITRSISSNAIRMTRKIAVGKQIKMATIVISGSVPNQPSNKSAEMVGSTMTSSVSNSNLRQSIRAVVLTAFESLPSTTYNSLLITHTPLLSMVARIITVGFLIAQIFTCELDTTFCAPDNHLPNH